MTIILREVVVRASVSTIADVYHDECSHHHHHHCHVIIIIVIILREEAQRGSVKRSGRRGLLCQLLHSQPRKTEVIPNFTPKNNMKHPKISLKLKNMHISAFNLEKITLPLRENLGDPIIPVLIIINIPMTMILIVDLHSVSFQ